MEKRLSRTWKSIEQAFYTASQIGSRLSTLIFGTLAMALLTIDGILELAWPGTRGSLLYYCLRLSTLSAAADSSSGTIQSLRAMRKVAIGEVLREQQRQKIAVHE